MTFEELEDLEDGLDFDLIVTLAPEAHHKALELTHRIAAAVEYWPTPDPTDIEGHREQRLDAYRRCATSCSRGFRRVFSLAARRGIASRTWLQDVAAPVVNKRQFRYLDDASSHQQSGVMNAHDRKS